MKQGSSHRWTESNLFQRDGYLYILSNTPAPNILQDLENFYESGPILLKEI